MTERITPQDWGQSRDKWSVAIFRLMANVLTTIMRVGFQVLLSPLTPIVRSRIKDVMSELSVGVAYKCPKELATLLVSYGISVTDGNYSMPVFGVSLFINLVVL